MARGFFEDEEEMYEVLARMLASDPSLDVQQLIAELVSINSGLPVSSARSREVWSAVVRVRIERARAARRGQPPRTSSIEPLDLVPRADEEVLFGRAEIEELLRKLHELEARAIAEQRASQPGLLETLAWLMRRFVNGFQDDGQGPGSPTPPSPVPGARLPRSRRRVKAGPFPRPFAGLER